MKLLFLRGLPGSGKSTWARKWVEGVKHQHDVIRVNRDDLRNMRGNYWIPKQEDMITEMENACCRIAFKNGKSVVLDATNLNNDRNRERYKMFKTEFPNLEWETMEFNVPVEECILRDLKRPNSVGEKVIRDMYNKYFAPAKVVYKEDESLEECVIFDVDGTLAKMNGRSPYEWKRVGEDSVNKSIADLSQTLFHSGKRIVIFTGRDGVCLPETKQWLNENEIYYHDVFIRPEGNTEKDSIIKKRLFEENIRGKYYCSFVVDDRNSVVDMWRKELGLTCLQVDYGDF